MLKLLLTLLSFLSVFPAELSRVLDTEGTHDDQHFREAALRVRCYQHAADFGVNRQSCHLPPCPGELAPGIKRIKLLKQFKAIIDSLRFRRFNKRKTADLTNAQVQHTQDH